MLSRVVVGYQVRVRVPEQVPGYGVPTHRYGYGYQPVDTGTKLGWNMGMGTGTGTMKWLWVRVRVPSHVETRIRVPQWVLGYGYQFWYLGTGTGTTSLIAKTEKSEAQICRSTRTGTWSYALHLITFQILENHMTKHGLTQKWQVRHFKKYSRDNFSVVSPVDDE